MRGPHSKQTFFIRQYPTIGNIFCIPLCGTFTVAVSNNRENLFMKKLFCIPLCGKFYVAVSNKREHFLLLYPTIGNIIVYPTVRNIFLWLYPTMRNIFLWLYPTMGNMFLYPSARNLFLWLYPTLGTFFWIPQLSVAVSNNQNIEIIFRDCFSLHVTRWKILWIPIFPQISKMYKLVEGTTV